MAKAPAASVSPPPPRLFTPEPVDYGEPVAEPAAAPGPRRRWPVIAVVSLVVVLAVAGAAAVLLRDGDRSPADDAGEPAPSTAARTFPEPPIPLVSDTELVFTDVLADGDLTVKHWLRTEEPVDRLELSAPGDGMTSAEVTDVVVAADGVAVASADVVAASGWAGPLPATSDVYVSYRLSGVLQLSDSAQGRGLATTTALVADVGRPMVARTQSFTGASVLTLACLPPGDQAMPTPCGSSKGDTWTVVSEGDAVADSVIAQVDLGAGQ
ncbi:hypothetical protein C7S10_19620 [Nocardioides currus]|uniref:Uncharacterized protein n=2 Tax=Nocardioides currus TaxID=2133958 RepID=A0A2R7YSL7_9ACTN|nr:hypothetical protein C7S10_19620 [Nocardioides currus]